MENVFKNRGVLVMFFGNNSGSKMSLHISRDFTAAFSGGKLEAAGQYGAKIIEKLTEIVPLPCFCLQSPPEKGRIVS